jgi:signal transduction histidine kinase
MTAQRLRREFLGTGAAAAGSGGGRDEAELTELLEVLGSETQRINRIVQQFLDFARPPRLALRPASLRDLVDTAAEALRAKAATRRITIESRAEHAGEAVVDPDQLRQAVDNLLRNAVEASPEGGTVRITARLEGGEAVIEVRDEGPGIPADALPKIFDLYFTTKADGTGVGLAVTNQIVEAHQGRIDVDSAPGRGTTMSIRIPAGEEASDRG